MTLNETETSNGFSGLDSPSRKESSTPSRRETSWKGCLRAVHAPHSGPSSPANSRSRNKIDTLLEENGLTYRELFHCAPAGLGLATPDGRVIACNTAMEEIFGYTQEELTGLSVQDLYENGSQREELLHILDRQGSVSGFEVMLLRKDGAPFTASLTMTPLPASGKALLLTLLQDVSTRVRDREELQGTYQVLKTVFENAHMQIAYLDRDFTYIRVNGPYASYKGMPPEDLCGRSYFDFSEHQGNLAIFRRAMETGQPYTAVAQPFESSGVSKDASGTSYWDWSLVPISEGEGPASGLILMFKDVTERVKAEQALGKSQGQLFQAQKMESLGVLVAGVAHEINNPINQIIFNIPLLEGIWQDVEPLMKAWALQAPTRTYGGLSFDFLKDNLPQLLDNMNMAANRIAQIVHDLKTFSRWSSASEKMEVHLNTAVNNAVRLARSTLQEAGIDLALELDEDLPMMEGNLPHLEQIVLNLLVNAVEATEGPVGEVRIRTFSRDDDLILIVSDKGKGIPPDLVNTLFDPFVTDRQAEGGTGLGLSVTNTLVRAHGADIAFDTQEGEGTTFTVTFPAKGKTVTPDPAVPLKQDG